MNEPLLNTVLLVGGVEGVCLPLGASLALVLERTNVRLRRTVWVLLIALLFLPLYLQAAAWDAGFGRQGWLTYRATEAVEPWLSGWRAAVWIHSCAALPWVTLLVAASLRCGMPAWEEQARLDAGPGRVLISVTLPRALPGILAAALWVAVMTASEMTVTDMYQVRTYAESLYLDLAAGIELSDLTWGALGNGVAALALTVAAASAAWLASSPRVVAPRRGSWRIELGGWRWPVGAAAAALVGLLWIVPLANLAYNAGVDVRAEGDRRVRAWSALEAVRQMASAPHEFQHEFVWTACIAGLAATLVVGVVLPVAWWARRSPAGIAVGCGLATLALAIPGPLLSLLLLTLRDHAPAAIVRVFDDTILVVAAVHAWRAAPLVWLLLIDTLRAFPNEEWEAAAVAGAAPLRRWFGLVLPRRKGALLAAWIVAAGVSLAEVSTSLLVGPQGIFTLSVRTFQLVHTGVDDRLAGLSLVTILLTWMLAAAVVWLGGWSSGDATPMAEDL